ncbi:flavodoxin domain-containing protein [Methanobacterium oryzae]|uniref:flavodoxin domain-containing protein n=1 Tax=Methanobacterium oryzae TaxID=69540 RepID=UPI003D204B33
MKALVAFGSRYGSSTEIAEEIGKVMKNEGFEVDLVNLRKNKVDNISPYDLIVVGSGIKMGKWTKEPLKFLNKYKTALKDKKVALFVSCGATLSGKEKMDEAWKLYLKKVANENLSGEPVSMGLFGGVFDPDANQGLMYKMAMKMAKKGYEEKGVDTSKRYDYRDWDEIRNWARKLANK